MQNISRLIKTKSLRTHQEKKTRIHQVLAKVNLELDDVIEKLNSLTVWDIQPKESPDLNLDCIKTIEQLQSDEQRRQKLTYKGVEINWHDKHHFLFSAYSPTQDRLRIKKGNLNIMSINTNKIFCLKEFYNVSFSSLPGTFVYMKSLNLIATILVEDKLSYILLYRLLPGEYTKSCSDSSQYQIYF